MKSPKEAKKNPEPRLHPIAEALAAHLGGHETHPHTRHLPAAQRADLASLLRLAERLDAHFQPLRPSPAFVRSLGTELVQEARRRQAQRKRRHRIAVISAAVAGGVVSVASLVGGIVVLVKWLRTRNARQTSAA